jgi:hypothetical protein
VTLRWSIFIGLKSAWLGEGAMRVPEQPSDIVIILSSINTRLLQDPSAPPARLFHCLVEILIIESSPVDTYTGLGTATKGGLDYSHRLPHL